MKSDEDQSPNGKKQTILMIAISLMIGFGGGWFSFRSKEIIEWHRIRTIMYDVGITDENWDEIVQSLPEMRSDIDKLLEDIDSGEKWNMVTSLACLKQLEAGKIEQTKKNLARRVASYYFIHGPPDVQENNISEEKIEMLNAIQKAMEESPFLKAEINKRPADMKK